MLVDYHTHPACHGEVQVNEHLLVRMVETAKALGIKELGLSDHDRLFYSWDKECLEAVRREFPEVKIRLGVEVSYGPSSRLELIRRFLQEPEMDYIICSVHSIDGWSFDEVDQLEGYDRWEPDELYRAYYSNLERGVRHGFGDIVGHLDVIKLFDYRPKSDPVKLAMPVLSAIRERGLTVEINANGLNKPVREIYPEQAIIEQCFAMDIPITLSSDDHSPEDIGRHLNVAKEAAWKAGYRRIATFEKRRRLMVHL